MTYRKTLDYLNSLVNYEKVQSYSYSSFKTGRINAFLKTINSPQKNVKFIHVAGTKGKGSTSAFIAYILREAGFSVGLFTSPHLSTFRERIRILSAKASSKTKKSTFEGIISKHDFIKALSTLRPRIERFNKKSKDEPLTLFEVLTILALVYFKNRKTEFAILETGLGGRLDATNVVSPLICIITSIGLEHEKLLGKTLRAIAREKAGIIKKRKNLVAISAPQPRSAREVIENRCNDLGVRLRNIGKDVIFTNARSNLEGQLFNLKTTKNYYQDLSIKMLGRHQLINAALAVSVAEELEEFDFKISEDSIRGGLANTLWPARLELIARCPDIILDAAHNKQSAHALTRDLKSNFKQRSIYIILGISKDKNIPEIARVIADVADYIMVTRSQNPRAAEVSLLVHALKKIRSEVRRKFALEQCPDFKKALDLTKGRIKRNGENNGLIVVTGSVFLVGDVRKYLCKDTPV